MKSTSISIIIAVVLVGGAVFLVKSGPAQSGAAAVPINNVSDVGGKQIIEIAARGGYFPRISSAKAGVPTVIRMKTSNTFDCSSFLVIPSLGYRNSLPQTGTTDIDVPPQQPGSVIQAVCGMGMYNFQIKFE